MTYKLQTIRKQGKWRALMALNKQSIQASPFLGSKESELFLEGLCRTVT